MKKMTILEGILTILVFVFLYTALSKLFGLSTFRFFLSESPILARFVPVIAIPLPVVELLTVVLLILPRTRLLGLWMAVCLLVAFTVYLAGMVIFAPTLPCGCGGILNQLSWKQHIALNIVLTALAVYGLWLQRSLKSRQGDFEPGMA